MEIKDEIYAIMSQRKLRLLCKVDKISSKKDTSHLHPATAPREYQQAMKKTQPQMVQINVQFSMDILNKSRHTVEKII